MTEQETLSVVMVGHVDHGKSTVIGRLMADAGMLPDGKIEQVRKTCETNAKPFEYAFFLDALKDEQAQGITIDSARCFFKTQKRNFVVIDAPGHVEFLKNMISGTTRADAALLVIDAKEGVKENTRKHASLLAFAGIKQIVVLINKMDLVGFNEGRYLDLVSECGALLDSLDLPMRWYVPLCARDGDNLATLSSKMPWYDGMTVLEHMDSFQLPKGLDNKPFKFPVQDIYKFTENGDDRRIIAGTVESGHATVGDKIIFLPSGQKTYIASIEGGSPATAGKAVGFTLKDDPYLQRGEVMCQADPKAWCDIGSRFKARLFWMGRSPMTMEKKYKLKIATARAIVYLENVDSITTVGESSGGRESIDRHEIADCVLKTSKTIAFDVSLDALSRFVIIDNYDIVGCGIILKHADYGNASSKWGDFSE